MKYKLFIFLFFSGVFHLFSQIWQNPYFVYDDDYYLNNSMEIQKGVKTRIGTIVWNKDTMSHFIEYDKYGRIIREKGENDTDTVTYRYDFDRSDNKNFNNIKNIPTNSEFQFNENGFPVLKISKYQSRKDTTRYIYNEKNKLTKIFKNNILTTEFEYDSRDSLVSVSKFRNEILYKKQVVRNVSDSLIYRIDHYNEKGEKLKIYDSVCGVYERGNLVEIITYPNEYDKLTDFKKMKYNKKNRIILENGEHIDEKGILHKSNYYEKWEYNKKGLIKERVATSSEGEVVLNIKYEYVYY